MYNIKVINNKKNYEIKIDGNVIEGREIILKNDGKIYNVEVQI